MCGRFVTPDIAAMERTWHIGRHNWLEFVLPSFNVAPTSPVPILMRAADGTLEGHIARWGLVPRWWKKPEPPAMTFIARAEEAAEKPMWRDALRSQRCLMPVQGWYEWKALTGSRNKQPYFVHAPGEAVLAFAALWSRWTPPDTPAVLTCALLTRAAAPAIEFIHARMPLVLRPEHFDEWLDPGTSPERIHELMAAPRTDLEGYAVSPSVNSVRNNSPALIEPLRAAGTNLPLL
jgi:putative SOS response-associated peptidase YedK